MRDLQHFPIRDKTAYMPLKLKIFMHSILAMLVEPVLPAPVILLLDLLALVLVAPMLLELPAPVLHTITGASSTGAGSTGATSNVL